MNEYRLQAEYANLLRKLDSLLLELREQLYPAHRPKER